MKAGRPALQAGWLQVASVATMLKLVSAIGVLLLLAVLVGVWITRVLRTA
jgi:hypothetical protein